VKGLTKILFWVGLFWLMIGLSSCIGGRTSQIPETTKLPTETLLPEASATPEPSPTPSKPILILVAPEGVSPALVEQVQPTLEDLADANGMTFMVQSMMNPAELDPNVKGVVVLPPDPGITNLAVSLPGVAFLAVGMNDIQPSGNVSVIPGEISIADQKGFLAGYLAAVVTPDWRAGVISHSDTLPGKSSSLGFYNGVIFYCGLCRPAYPPFNAYPILANIPQTNSDTEKASLVQSLVDSGVTTVYISPEINDPGLLQNLADAGIKLIGNGVPLPGLEGSWIASIGIDLESALQENFSDWISGEAGTEWNVVVGFDHANPDLFSPGKQGLVELIQDDLQNGFIDTGVDPQTGEPLP